ncbi:family 78 glycoside hydrolase catalytic domain [Mariniphaga sediminis]|uniref:family 78 glycoside hydrolase catalytic domain n=1 Tax=Mariniphaga sediminis TaxID=1628158 RepID=UPI003569067A
MRNLTGFCYQEKAMSEKQIFRNLKKRTFRFGRVLLVAFLLSAHGFSGNLSVEHLRCEYLVNPLGIQNTTPRLSWILTSEERNQVQTAYRILVSSTPEKLANNNADLWDSGKIESNQTNQIVYSGKQLQSRDECYWKVRVWDESGAVSESSVAYWSVGLLNYSDWKAKWITHNVEPFTGDKYEELYLPPARYLRKSFKLGKQIKSAKVYASALGLYELRLNGQKVGDACFTPGWTDYNKRVYYNTYDVTGLLKEGENAIGAILADGWYAGYIGYALFVKLDKVRGFYGESPSFIGQLEVTFTDGSKEIIASSEEWMAGPGPIREADILMGEVYDARLENTGWDQPGFNAENWEKADLGLKLSGALEAYPGVLVKHREEIQPIEMTEPEKGTYIFNLGKNIAGVIRLKVSGEKGEEVTIRYGEMLHDDGSLMTENLRKARATDTYILKGEGVEIWEPRFTYHGFQYVEVTGLSQKPDLSTITGIVMNSDTKQASTFTCSSEMNNQLYQNILTTQFANFFDIPTDCPQRDERLGWTGDAQLYSVSAAYNADVSAFFTKWMQDVDDGQLWYGAYPIFAPIPYIRPYHVPHSPAWSDAGIVIPYNMYKIYGDTLLLRRMYPGMKRFMDFQLSESNGFLRPGSGNNYGDWLSLGKETSKDLIASAYFAYDTKMMFEIAQCLNQEEDAVYYQHLFQNIKKDYTRQYMNEDGSLKEHTQTAYALSLYMGLYPENLKEQGAASLAKMITENGNRFSSGFIGTKHVMLVLSDFGYNDLAYSLFTQTEYPSWGYSVVNGSTSIWERWNSYTKETGFLGGKTRSAMNSFSHYSFGAVAEWMFSKAAGINTDGPGFRKIIIKPSIGEGLQFMNASYNSINGRIVSNWKKGDDRLELHVEIPANTSAQIYVPSVERKKIREGKTLIGKSNDFSIVGINGIYTVLQAGSGVYDFTIEK